MAVALAFMFGIWTLLVVQACWQTYRTPVLAAVQRDRRDSVPAVDLPRPAWSVPGGDVLGHRAHALTGGRDVRLS